MSDTIDRDIPRINHAMSAIRPQDRYMEINGLRFHYLDWGNDKQQPMVLLHGFLAHAHVWDDFALNFRSHYHVIALDQRGHGESQWSKDGAYTMDDHFSDIAHFIETLDLNDLILIGHSMGGRHALFCAACVPYKVDRLILVDARPGNDLQASHALRRLLATFPLEAHSLKEVVQAIRSLYPYLSREMCYHIANHGYKRVQQGTYIPKYDTRMSQQSDDTGYATEELWPFMEHVPCPVLLIRGKESLFLSRKIAQQMCRALPQTKFKEIPESTHMPVQENPIATTKVIADFLQN